MAQPVMADAWASAGGDFQKVLKILFSVVLLLEYFLYVLCNRARNNRKKNQEQEY